MCCLAPIAQWIEYRPPEPGAQVQILLGAPDIVVFLAIGERTMPTITALPTYISLQEAGARYGVSQTVLRRAVDDGIIRAVLRITYSSNWTALP